jgi:hypothetical protein
MATPRWSLLPTLLAAACSAVDVAPPVVTYGSSRESSQWLDIGGGNQVAIDRGASFRGTTAYLSLLWDLIAVDDATGKVRWSRSVGAFWNELTFAEIPGPDGQRTWVIELRPGPGETRAPEQRQYHDLATGQPLDLPTASPGPDVPIPRQWHGGQSLQSQPLQLVVGDEETWQTRVVAMMFGGSKAAPDFGPIDWSTHLALVIAAGDALNCDGYSARAFDQGGTLLLRLDRHSYQTAGPTGGGQRVRPWGIFVLGRREPFGCLVVQYNAQNLIGGPELWTELCRFDSPGAGATGRRPPKGG